jgi:hypothetical protein
VDLPNAENAFVLNVKLTGYFFLFAHPRGRGKALFFASFGFSPSAPQALEHALLQHAQDNRVLRILETPHGVKYEIEGPLRAPDDSTPVVKTIWMIDHGTKIPRLIAAFPGKRPSR